VAGFGIFTNAVFAILFGSSLIVVLLSKPTLLLQESFTNSLQMSNPSAFLVGCTYFSGVGHRLDMRKLFLHCCKELHRVARMRAWWLFCVNTCLNWARYEWQIVLKKWRINDVRTRDPDPDDYGDTYNQVDSGISCITLSLIIGNVTYRALRKVLKKGKKRCHLYTQGLP